MNLSHNFPKKVKKLKENQARILLGLQPFTSVPFVATQRNKDPQGMNYSHVKQRATEPWEHKETFKAASDIAAAMTAATGEEWNIDHIVPLRGENVCGLNTACNLEIVPKSLNEKKGNTYEI